MADSDPVDSLLLFPNLLWETISIPQSTVCTGKKCQENGATQIYEKCKDMLPPNCTRRTSNGKCITSKCSKGVRVTVQSMVGYDCGSDTNCKRYGTKLYNIPTNKALCISTF